MDEPYQVYESTVDAYFEKFLSGTGMSINLVLSTAGLDQLNQVDQKRLIFMNNFYQVQYVYQLGALDLRFASAAGGGVSSPLGGRTISRRISRLSSTLEDVQGEDTL